MQKIHRILIVEDHSLLREGLITMISSDPDVMVCGEAENGREAIQKVIALNPDLVLLDINMPIMNGPEALVEIKRRAPDVKVIMLTAHNAEEYVRECMQNGVQGYVMKDATRNDLMTAIHDVLRGKTYLSPDVASQIMHGYLGEKNAGASSWDSLSTRERQVLKLVAEGHSNKSVSALMFISIKTVEKHRSNLMKKLGLHNTAELTAFAYEKGLVANSKKKIDPV